MNIIILTSNRKGSASYCLKQIAEKSEHKIAAVIYSRQVIKNKKKFYLRKFRKALKIGPGGVINGFRMRKWYGEDLQALLGINDIEQTCKECTIPFHVVDSINSPEVIGLLKQYHADLGISLGNSFISPEVFSTPGQGMINLHGEQLPAFQNAQSVIWQLYEGNRQTGYTIHMIERKIDTGEIVKQEVIPIEFRETLGQTVTATCARILEQAANGLIDVLSHWEKYRSNARFQGKGNHYTTPSLWQFRKILNNYRKFRKLDA